MVRWFILILSLLQACSIFSPAQTIAPDTPEPGSVEAIAAATGDKRFLSPWVSYLPQSATVPSPLHSSGTNRRARRANLSIPPRPTPIAALWPPLLRESGFSPSATAKKGAKSCWLQSQTKPASATSIV